LCESGDAATLEAREGSDEVRLATASKMVVEVAWIGSRRRVGGRLEATVTTAASGEIQRPRGHRATWFKREKEGARGVIYRGRRLGEGARVLGAWQNQMAAMASVPEPDSLGAKKPGLTSRPGLSAAGQWRGTYRFGVQVSGPWAKSQPRPIQFPQPFFP
jgi:hypothetical protein